MGGGIDASGPAAHHRYARRAQLRSDLIRNKQAIWGGRARTDHSHPCQIAWQKRAAHKQKSGWIRDLFKRRGKEWAIRHHHACAGLFHPAHLTIGGFVILISQLYQLPANKTRDGAKLRIWRIKNLLWLPPKPAQQRVGHPRRKLQIGQMQQGTQRSLRERPRLQPIRAAILCIKSHFHRLSIPFHRLPTSQRLAIGQI